MSAGGRIVWIDWLKVTACLLVMVAHSTEPFYLGGGGSLVASRADAWWAGISYSLVRCCVPLFVVASSYLLFPLKCDTRTFFRKRASRILIPFAVWSVLYTFIHGNTLSDLKSLPLNFNYASGHLWFVYMILGLYLLMPLLSPWAEKVGRRELGFYIWLWLFTTLVPFIRDWACGGNPAVIYGPTGIPRQAEFPLWGEASWNAFGTLYYFSGFIGYLLVGLWLRKFGDTLSRKASVGVGIPCIAIGFAIALSGFIRRVFSSTGGIFPSDGLIDRAVWWETSWTFCSTGVVLMTIGTVLLFRTFCADGRLYRAVVVPLSQSSYGMYLGHMVALGFYAGLFRRLIDCTPLCIITTAVTSFVTVALCARILHRIPHADKVLGV